MAASPVAASCSMCCNTCRLRSRSYFPGKACLDGLQASLCGSYAWAERRQLVRLQSDATAGHRVAETTHVWQRQQWRLSSVHASSAEGLWQTGQMGSKGDQPPFVSASRLSIRAVCDRLADRSCFSRLQICTVIARTTSCMPAALSLSDVPCMQHDLWVPSRARGLRHPRKPARFVQSRFWIYGSCAAETRVCARPWTASAATISECCFCVRNPVRARHTAPLPKPLCRRLRTAASSARSQSWTRTLADPTGAASLLAQCTDAASFRLHHETPPARHDDPDRTILHHMHGWSGFCVLAPGYQGGEC